MKEAESSLELRNMPIDKPTHVYVHTAVEPSQMAMGIVGIEIAVKQGNTTHFVVHYAQSLGANGVALANAVLATCEADYDRLRQWFGNIKIDDLPFRIYIKPAQATRAVRERH